MTAHDDDNPQVYRMGEGPYALNDDDTAKDPVAFREALAKDVGKLKDIEKDEALAKALLGEDTGAMQEALKKLMTMVRNQSENQANYDMHSNDLMRASCTVPRDPVVLYEHMNRAGLQYGPAFRLLSQVWVPESLDQEQRKTTADDASLEHETVQ